MDDMATAKSKPKASPQKVEKSTRLSARPIKQYLEALETNKPKRGRKRTPDSIARRLERIDEEMATASPVKKLELTQERMNLSDELANMQAPIDMTAIEDEFVAAAKAYGQHKGISYAAWREIGVPAAVLKRAGISRAAS
ncbi:MAG: hypothetical protein M3Y51_11595 [Actinomycetota bacterium]|nr:hypothetical protein [Actinomycetota bacterium]